MNVYTLLALPLFYDNRLAITHNDLNAYFKNIQIRVLHSINFVFDIDLDPL